MTNSPKWGRDKLKVPKTVNNFIYGPKTGNTNLRRHLYLDHGEEYDKVVLMNKWPYRLSTQSHEASTQSREASSHNTRNRRDVEVPPFSREAFLEHLVRFVVADDQVCPDNLAFFLLAHSYNISVDSRCRMPGVSTIMYGTLSDSCRRRHPSPR
jgi:hypothetical protein